MRMKERLRVGLLTAVLALMAAGPVFAQQTSLPDRTRRFELGTDIGFAGGTLDGTAFAVGIYGDFPIIPHVSIGPLMQLALTNDLFQIGVTAQAKVTLDIPDVPELKPQFQVGIGFVHADLDVGPNTADDTSWLIPVGFGLEYRAMKNLYVGTTLLLNFTNLDIAGRSDDLDVAWFVGLRFLL
jgi:hypothetical protein